MRFYIVVIFGILFQFLSLFLFKIFSFLPETPDLIVILVVYLICYEEDVHLALFFCWILGLLKDGMSVEYFGVYSIIFSVIGFLLLRLKFIMDLTNIIIMSLLVLFFTLQYCIIHSMIIFVRWDVDLAQTSIISAFCTAVFTPLIVPLLNVFNEKNRRNLGHPNMLDIQNNQLVKIFSLLLILILIAIGRLAVIQVIDHEYYEMKTISQRKMSKEISLRREYLILPPNTSYQVEINLWLLIDKRKKLIFRDSMRNLSKLIGVDEQTIYWLCLNKFRVVQQIIQRKIQEESNIHLQKQELISKIEYRELNKPYPLNVPRINRHQVIKLEIEKYLWIDKKDIGELSLYDRFKGFSVRAIIPEKE